MSNQKGEFIIVSHKASVCVCVCAHMCVCVCVRACVCGFIIRRKHFAGNFSVYIYDKVSKLNVRNIR